MNMYLGQLQGAVDWSKYMSPPIGGNMITQPYTMPSTDWGTPSIVQQQGGQTGFGFPGGGGYAGPETTKFGANLGTANAILSGLQTLGGLYMGFKQLGLAKTAQRTSLAFANRNLENQTKSMNMALEDRTANRQAMYAGTGNAMSADQARAYLDKNRFNTAPITKRG